MGQERASRTNCPGPAALPPPPSPGWTSSHTAHGQVNVAWGPRRSICILGRLLQLHDTPRYSPAQAEFTAPPGLSWRCGYGGAGEQPLTFLGPLGHPMAGTEKQAQTLAEPALRSLTLRPTAPTLRPSLCQPSGVLSSGEWFTGSCSGQPQLFRSSQGQAQA